MRPALYPMSDTPSVGGHYDVMQMLQDKLQKRKAAASVSTSIPVAPLRVPPEVTETASRWFGAAKNIAGAAFQGAAKGATDRAHQRSAMAAGRW